MAHSARVSVETSHDPLTRMRVYQIAAELIPDAFEDAKALLAEPITKEIAGQMYAAVCSIEANISEATRGAPGKIVHEYSSTHLDRFGKA